MLGRQLSQASVWRQGTICLFCAARTQLRPPLSSRLFATSSPLAKNRPVPRRVRRRLNYIKSKEEAKERENKEQEEKEGAEIEEASEQQDVQEQMVQGEEGTDKEVVQSKEDKKTATAKKKAETAKKKAEVAKKKAEVAKKKSEAAKKKTEAAKKTTVKNTTAEPSKEEKGEFWNGAKSADEGTSMSLKEALLAAREKSEGRDGEELCKPLDINVLFPEALDFTPVEVDKPPVPMLSYGLDRVLFNPGVYRLQDARSRVYNFDPYLEKIMPVSEFNFDALSEYKTSSKDEELLAITQKTGAKFTGSTSSMSGILQHFHYALSNFRPLNHDMLSRQFPKPVNKFSRITLGPNAVFLRYKDGVYAIDDDKSYDSPNIMSWLGHSLEKLLTTERSEFERFRRSNAEEAPVEGNSSRCYHYTKQGNLLMRSQLDAYDPRLPGTGIFDLKTRAVVSIRMDHRQYEKGAGYQLRHSTGLWESFEREFYDMTRATLLKYSLQVRMGRMDGIFIAYHNVERIFGFQYLSLADLDEVLHGQRDTTLGDHEFKLSVALVDEIISKATAQFPNTSLRLHVEARPSPFIYIFAEPVTEEQADKIQTEGDAKQKEFARTVVGVGKNDPEVQAAWRKTQNEVDEQLAEDHGGVSATKTSVDEAELHEEADEMATQETDEEAVEEVIEPDEEAIEETNEETIEEMNEEVTEETTIGLEEELGAEADSEATAPSAEEENMGPLMGWTLTVRSKVNDHYVSRPAELDSDDSWSLEYHMQEIPESKRWKLYNALKERRRELIGQNEEEVDKHLKFYRELIHRYSAKGKIWRMEQDEMTKDLGVTVYQRMGPGSGVGEYASDAGPTSAVDADAGAGAEEGEGDVVDSVSK